MVDTPPSKGFVMDDKARGVGKNEDDNAMRSYALRNDTCEPAIIQDDLKQPVSPEKSGVTGNNALRNSNALRKAGECLHCGAKFERRTTWHKYCNELCKIKAYELRTGKKWKGKKAA